MFQGCTPGKAASAPFWTVGQLLHPHAGLLFRGWLLQVSAARIAEIWLLFFPHPPDCCPNIPFGNCVAYGC